MEIPSEASRDPQSVSDLEGKTVSVGDAASGVYFNAIDILDAYGIDISTGVKAVYELFSDSAESLLNGEIDAAFIVAGAPTILNTVSVGCGDGLTRKSPGSK